MYMRVVDRMSEVLVMASLLGWLRGRGERSTKREGRGAVKPGDTVGTFRTVSVAEDVSRLDQALDGFVRLLNETPFLMLQVYRFLRDAIPDVSDAVWTWKRLCQRGYDIEIVKASREVAKRRAERLLRELDARVNSGDRGMDGLLDVFYTSLFTYGATALEIVLTESRESIWDVVPARPLMERDDLRGSLPSP